jgi:inosine-uridine nucleoside N-ribohydrolase
MNPASDLLGFPVMKRPGFLFALLLACSLLTLKAAEPIPLLVDTDIGTDIDDAFAFALLFKSPEVKVLGVTTVAGDTSARARVAAKLMAVAGGDWTHVPVYAGLAAPLQPAALQPSDQLRWAHGFQSHVLHLSGAVDFMEREINRSPGQVTILALGELTNVAALLKKDPSIAKRIHQIVLMGGAVRQGYTVGSAPVPEWNIVCNIPAAQTVFSSGVPLLVAPLDVTAMLPLNFKDRHQVLTRLTPVTDALALLYLLWVKDQPSLPWGRTDPTLFDPMALAMLIQPDLCQTKKLALEVDAKGVTQEMAGKKPNAVVGLKTDPKRFLKFYLDRVAP